MAIAKRQTKRALENGNTDRVTSPHFAPGAAGELGVDTRSRLLIAAIELFGSKGFDSTTMKDLGAHAGVGAPAAYNHFPSKDAILVEAVTWAMQGFFTSVTSGDDPSASSEARLERIVVSHITWQIEHSRLARANDLLINSDLLARIGQRAAHKRIRSMLRAHLDLVTRVVRDVLQDRPQSGLDPRLCALAIGSMCDDVIKWYRADGKYPAAKIAQMYWSLTQRMLGITPF